MNLKNSLVNKVLICIICLGILAFAGCKKEENNDNNQNDNGQNNVVENVNEHTTYDILENTIYQTTVHIFKSNIHGPKVAIVGGIHGDEVAGWKAALELVKRDNFQGEVMIIPEAHKLADTLQHRYPGYKVGVTTTKEYDGIKYTDLNRTFPGKANGTPTEKIANAIAVTIETFAPDYIIDLHESRRSVMDSNPLLGDQLIYGNSNSSLFVDDIVYEFNKTSILKGENPFSIDSNAPAGSFCNYFGNLFSESIVFTIETNRETKNGIDTANLNRRIEQQTQIIDLIFKTIWK